MGLFNSIRLGSSAAGDYEIERSLKNDVGTADVSSGSHLSRTFASGNRKTFTISVWVKKCNTPGSLGDGDDHYSIFSTGGGGSGSSSGNLSFGSNDRISLLSNQSGSILMYLQTTRKFRDPSAWYHIVCAVDTTQATASNRAKIYVNGVQETSFDTETYPSQDQDLYWNFNNSHRIGAHTVWSSGNTYANHNGYIAEFHFIDGTALTPASFGETKAATGQWNPKKYAGSYGTNGFYLNFADNSGATATTLGKDSSGQGNNWTPNSLGVGDSVKDSPTNNFCTLNSAIKSPDITFSEGNLKGVNNTQHKGLYGTFGLSSGKWYWEAEAISGSTTKWTYGVSDVENVGQKQVSGTNYLIGTTSGDNLTFVHGDAVSIYNSHLYKNGTKVTDSYTTNPSAGDIIGVALDVDAGKVWFSRNGTWINGSASASTTLDASNHDTTVATGKSYTPAFSVESVGWCTNFGQDSSFANSKTAQGNTDGNGQGDFYYAVPSGFKAICNANLPDPAIALPNKHFDTLLWTGNGSSRNITGLEFDPDWVWIKNRDLAYDGELYDTVRGNTNRLFSGDTGWPENMGTGSTGGLSFGVTGGFAITGSASLNANSDDIVGWCWDVGSSTVTNDDGSIDSQVRANTTAGISIATWTSGSSMGTAGHGLGVAPDVCIRKVRSAGSNYDWIVHHDLVDGSHDYLRLNKTNSNAGTSVSLPTSSVMGTDDNNGLEYVVYSLSQVEGFSKFDTFRGNASYDGTFVYTGFKPAWLMLKNCDNSSGYWVILDNKRRIFNPRGPSSSLYANLNSVENTFGNATGVDFLSNGFKIRDELSYVNGDGNDIFYMAFAESPFQYSRAG